MHKASGVVEIMRASPVNKIVEIEINEKWCKGCEICVDVCPHDVLVMENGIAKVKDLESCTACNRCELQCPDFAIVVISPKQETQPVS